MMKGWERTNVTPGVSEKKSRERNKSKQFKMKHDDDVNCIVCGELISESRPGETWVMCVVCANWAHLQCTLNDGKTYVCDDCSPDSYRLFPVSYPWYDRGDLVVRDMASVSHVVPFHVIF